MQTAKYGRTGRIKRDIGRGLKLVNWRFLLTFSSKSVPIRALPTGADCATLRPPPPPAVALPRARTISLAPQGPSDDCAATFVRPRPEARGPPSALDDLRHALGDAAGSAAGCRLLEGSLFPKAGDERDSV